MFCLDNRLGKENTIKAESPELTVAVSQRPAPLCIKSPEKIKQSGFFAQLKNFFGGFKNKFDAFTEKHPYIWGIIKWLVIPTTITTALICSGGLFAIPILGAWIATTSLAQVVGTAATMMIILSIESILTKIFATSSKMSRALRDYRPQPSNDIRDFKESNSSTFEIIRNIPVVKEQPRKDACITVENQHQVTYNILEEDVRPDNRLDSYIKTGFLY